MMLTWFARDDTPMLTGQRVLLRAPRAGDYMAWRDLQAGEPRVPETLRAALDRGRSQPARVLGAR